MPADFRPAEPAPSEPSGGSRPSSPFQDTEQSGSTPSGPTHQASESPRSDLPSKTSPDPATALPADPDPGSTSPETRPTSTTGSAGPTPSRPAPDVPEIDLADPSVITDPFTAYGHARGQGPVARLSGPGFGPVWVLTRHAEARAMLTDPRFALGAGTFQPLDVPEHCRPYMRTMQEMEGEPHARLRRLTAPAFAARRALAFRPRIDRVVARLLDALPEHEPVDLITAFAQPLPMEVICELVGVPEADRPNWHEYGSNVVRGSGEGFATAVPGIIDGARDLVAHPDSELLRHLTEDAGLTGQETVALVWQLVLAGQTPANFLANAVDALITYPDQLAVLRDGPHHWPNAVDELMRWCGSQLLTIPRRATQDVELYGVTVREGEQVTVSIAAANRDPRVFPEPDRLDVRRAAGGHLGFAFGPHFCLGASFARVQIEVALTALFDRFPTLRTLDARRAPDPGTWRLATLQVSG
ncbi:cytochrome P450 [Amycolatopsis sulphurea]|uniref:Cytochrome P450 n=1 Tax=Amycolatopsis sulphurea TaxID=76022 RepID=A0A2A9FZH3_9PSEU|nr:cytochrome P450 [Amycolatopsis sulphurea]